ncbi:uncharacterized protein K444DRAFT_720433 [Hyaloscypha bicolor E]|uniref:Shikimate dehydrogenase substrate binding N-terminal domain-containing protein n=1 Tax=Hyaloscypha bicolor E TaxID=1095630 RepID=A0A2J6TCT5_9HELO|nr:uncharacterized protein K444DRAFT_720433 [Hyaloscypha bicolor E]PMD60819.1 hypothetical protein K444DRAFT_720433 [Hyaloscypha bicolor E]
MEFVNPEVEAKYIYIFGLNISFSKPPILRQVSFKNHNLPHTYTVHKTTSNTPLAPIKSPAFGGTSVTMPHKVSISTYSHQFPRTIALSEQ